MQITDEPRLETEKEDVHLIRSFLISTKENQAGWKLNRETGHEEVKKFIGKPFVMIPERIFKPLDEGRGGHVASDTYENEIIEIAKNTHGNIQKLYGPFYYDDSPKDYWYEAGTKLGSSQSAAILIENGSKTWDKFAVSPHIWTRDEPHDVKTFTPMGLFLVIKGAYGSQAVINKMCNGSELKCGTSLSSAIQNINDNTMPEILNSFIQLNDSKNVNMAAQQVEKFTEPFEAKEVPLVKVDNVTTPIKVEEKKVEEVKVEQPKGITISNEEFEAYKKEREEHKQLVLENKTNKLNTLFNVVTEAEAKNELVKKYINEDVNLLVKFSNDLLPHVEKFNKGKDVETKTDEGKSETASVLKDEPKKEKEESLAGSIVPNKVNEVLDFSEMFEGNI